MKNILIGIVLLAFFIGVFFGCEDVGPSGNWITVDVRPSGSLIKKNRTTGEEFCDYTTKYVDGTYKVNIGRELPAKTDSNCYFIFYMDEEIHDIKLYEGQCLTIWIRVNQTPGGYTQVPGEATLTYDDALSNAPSNWYYQYHPIINVYWLYD